MKINIIKSEIDKVDLTHLVDIVSRDDHKKIIIGEAGLQHYKLLSYLSKQINNSTIVELGTHHGTSCLCLCENKTNRVVTFDVTDKKFGIKKIPENLTRHIGNIFNINPRILLESSLVFLDTAHDGDFELEILNFLIENNYKGLLLLDDIHYNNSMINFWNNINLTKYDITSVGHGIITPSATPTGKSGTGIVDFNNNIQIIRLND